MKQLNLFPEPENTLERECLINSLHSTSGARERWERRRSMNLTDKQLKVEIASEWGLGGGATYPATHCYQGGSNPRLWVGNISPIGNPTFSGQPLIDLVRSLLIS
jgi:hypothetical protein